MGSTASSRSDSGRPSPGRAGLWGVLLGALLGAAGAAACAFPLDDEISCGDGYVDVEAGEECDPGKPSSYEHACLGTARPDGTASCNRETCTIINTPEQCASCGDGKADGLEDCDRSDLRGQVCPGGVGTLLCSDTCRFDLTYCKRCGNGVVDPGEECDPNSDPTDLTQGKPMCSELESPYLESKPFTSGRPGSCRDDCRWDRAGCGYCGNDRVETTDIVDFNGTRIIPEWCDGNTFDAETLDKELADSLCTTANPDLRPIVTCADDCLDFILHDGPEPCCVKTGGVCPADGVPLRCCREVDRPDEEGDPCQVIFDSFGNVVEVCR